jgi:hypothetical protein
MLELIKEKRNAAIPASVAETDFITGMRRDAYASNNDALATASCPKALMTGSVPYKNKIQES